MSSENERIERLGPFWQASQRGDGRQRTETVELGGGIIGPSKKGEREGKKTWRSNHDRVEKDNSRSRRESTYSERKRVGKERRAKRKETFRETTARHSGSQIQSKIKSRRQKKRLRQKRG